MVGSGVSMTAGRNVARVVATGIALLFVLAVGSVGVAMAEPPPTVTSINPESGPTAGGTPVTITGSGFVSPATVAIGSAASAVEVISETEIKATTAATTVGPAEVVVSDASGTSNGGPKYTYIAPPPSVESITPNQGPTAGGTPVTIKGKGFLEGSTVTIGGAASEVKVVNEEEITAKTPVGSGAPEVIVTDTGGSSTLGPTYIFIAPPSVESITPNQGPTVGGTPVTITGSGFVSPATVTIGSAATEVVVHSETEITAKTAATSVGPAEVVVSDENGTSTLGSSYNYVAPPLITLNPINQIVTAGEDATFMAVASGTPVPGVQWEVSANGGATWTNDTTDAGNATTTLTVASTAGQNGYEYRAVFTNTVSSVTSMAATLTVNVAPVVTVSPANKTVLVGESAGFSAEASGNPNPSVQWEVSANGGATWTNDTTDAGNTTDTLTVPATVAQNGHEYRAVFKNVAGEATSNPATLTVEYAPVVTGNTESKGVIVGQDAVFTASASGNPAPSVQWQVSTDFEKTWTNDTTDPGRTTSTLTVESATLAENGHEYRAVFSNSAGIAEGNSATLTVSEHTEAPKVIHDPTSTTVVAGEFATFTAEASGVPAPAMQWQVSKNGGSTWTNAVGKGAKSVTLVLEHVLAVQSGNEYRAVFKNVAGEMTSNVATLTVDTAPVVTANPVSKTVIAGETTVFTAAASGSPVPAVQWRVSTDGGATWTSDTVDMGNKTNSLTVASTTAAENGYEYRAVFASSAGNAESNAATLTVDTAPIVTINPASKVVLAGETVTLIASASGTPTPEVQWQESTDGGSIWITVPGATTDTLTLLGVPLSDSGREYRAVFTNSAGHVESTPAKLAVTAPTMATSSTQLPSPTASPPARQPPTATVAPSPPTPRTMLPFPIVRIAGSIDAIGAKLNLLTVQAPSGAHIAIRCRGRGCPKAESRIVASRSVASTTLVEFRRFERSLRAGAVLEIRISKGGEIGKYTRFTIRRGKPPARVDTCLSPTGVMPMVCPSS
jgi:hypothetical protein